MHFYRISDSLKNTFSVAVDLQNEFYIINACLYYNDEYAAINCVIFLVLQWCYSDVSNVIKSNNFFNNGPIRVSFAHIMQHCILDKCPAFFSCSS